MSLRHDTYTGGEHYWISPQSGSYAVKEEGFLENRVVFTGNYESCVAWLNSKMAENYEYDTNI